MELMSPLSETTVVIPRSCSRRVAMEAPCASSSTSILATHERSSLASWDWEKVAAAALRPYGHEGTLVAALRLFRMSGRKCVAVLLIAASAMGAPVQKKHPAPSASKPMLQVRNSPNCEHRVWREPRMP